MTAFCESRYANVHRGVHALGEAATHAYEEARTTVAHFIGASGPDEVDFVRGATEAMTLGLVAASFGRATLRPGDQIIRH